MDLLIDTGRLQYLLTHRLLVAEDFRCANHRCKARIKRLLLRSVWRNNV